MMALDHGAVLLAAGAMSYDLLPFGGLPDAVEILHGTIAA